MARAISPTENHLKVRFLNELRRAKRIHPATIIANELPLGGTGVRADLALHSRQFTGIEVKSNRDSLKRLSHQLPVYRDYFDKTILVLGSKHWEEALSLDLSGIELWIADGLTLKRVQPGEKSIQTRDHSQLLPATLQKKYHHLHSDARTRFLIAFRERFEATSNQFWKAIANRHIGEPDLVILSRFSSKRQQSAAHAHQMQNLHEQWINELSQSIHSSSVSRNDVSSS